MTEHKTKNEDNKPKLSAENRLVFNEVARYLEGGDKLSDYAIMLSGAWGIGKTYFLKNFIYPLIQDNTSRLSEFYPENENGKSSDIVKGLKSRRPIYISLAGINSFDRLNELLQIQAGQFLHPERIDSIEAQARRLELLAKGVEDLSGSHYLNLDKDKDVLCFDDLERIDPDFMEEALGYINTYIEHQQIKTIFLCNEDEIGRSEKVQYYENELDRFKTDKSTINKILNKTNSDIDKDPIVMRFKAKVEEEKDIYWLNIARFKKIKEKYIRHTLKLGSQIEFVVDVDECEDIQSNKPNIVQVFNDEQSQNIRTWFAARFSIVKVMQIIDTIGIKDKYISKIKNEIIEEICKTIIIVKELNKRPDRVLYFSSDRIISNDVTQEELSSKIIQRIKQYKFLEKRAKREEIESFIEEPFAERGLEEKIEEYKTYAENGNLDFDLLIRLASILIWIESFGIKEEIIDVEDLKKWVDKSKENQNLSPIESLNNYHIWERTDKYATKYYNFLEYVEQVNEELKGVFNTRQTNNVFILLENKDTDKEQIKLIISNDLDSNFEKEKAQELLDILKDKTTDIVGLVYKSFRRRYGNSDRLNPTNIQQKEAPFIIEFTRLSKKYIEDEKENNSFSKNDIPLDLLNKYFNEISEQYKL